MPPRCECAVSNINIWKAISGRYNGHQVYFCPNCLGLFTKVHKGTVEPDDEEEEDVPIRG
jgi:hypothetical protein